MEKAFKSRRIAFDTRFFLACKKVSDGAEDGQTSIILENMDIAEDKKSAEYFTENGYDIQIIKKSSGSTCTKISFENAEEGRKGTISYKDETDKEDKKGSI